MKHAILPTSALLMLVWLHLPTAAKAPLTPLRTRPPDYYQVIIANNLFRPLGWTKAETAARFWTDSHGHHAQRIKRLDSACDTDS